LSFLAVVDSTHFQDSLLDLLSASLVCRRWRTLAQAELGRRLAVMKGEEQMERWLASRRTATVEKGERIKEEQRGKTMLRKTQGELDKSRLLEVGGGVLTAERSSTMKTQAIGKRQRPICIFLIRGGTLAAGGAAWAL
jgi:hypothetical protein